jgi:hypothetical protein
MSGASAVVADLPATSRSQIAIVTGCTVSRATRLISSLGASRSTSLPSRLVKALGACSAS